MRAFSILSGGAVVVFGLACGGGSAPGVASPAPVAEEIPVIAPERHLVLAGAWVQVALGSDGCARASDGAVTCWEGLGARSFAEGEHAEFTLEGAFSDLSVGKPFIGGVRTDGTLAGRWRPGWQELDGPFTTASFGDGFACGLTAPGAVKCLELEGEAPPAVPDGDGWVALAGDARGGCALDASGAPRCWGQWAGAVPTRVALTDLDVGRRWACGVQDTGSLRCWGEGAAAPAGPFVDVDVAEVAALACGVRADGVIACWSSEVRYTVAAASGAFEQVAVGRGGACGLRSDGALECWPAGQRL